MTNFQWSIINNPKVSVLEFSVLIEMFGNHLIEMKVSLAVIDTHTPTQRMQWGPRRSKGPRRWRTAGWRWGRSWPSSIHSSSYGTSSQSLWFPGCWSLISPWQTQTHSPRLRRFAFVFNGIKTWWMKFPPVRVYCSFTELNHFDSKLLLELDKCCIFVRTQTHAISSAPAVHCQRRLQEQD